MHGAEWFQLFCTLGEYLQHALPFNRIFLDFQAGFCISKFLTTLYILLQLLQTLEHPLEDYSKYEVTVVATNGGGNSPPVSTVFISQDASECTKLSIS